MDEDVTGMTDEQLAEQALVIETERARRAVITDAEIRTDGLCLEYLRASGRENGAAWEAPVGFLGAYPRGWRVTHDGGIYEATAPGTVTAPPSDDWDEVDPDTPLIGFWEPRPYSKGDQARDAGQVWTATSDVDGARPSAYPGGWSLTD